MIFILKNMKQEKLIRKLRHLIYNAPQIFPDYYDAKYIQHPNLGGFVYGFFNISHQYAERLKFIKESPMFNMDKRMKVQKQIWDLYVQLGWTPKQMSLFAREVLTSKQNNKDKMKGSTYNREKDNSIWGTARSQYGNSNRNKIRFPRKCRKTAWKRFYKLFPHLKETQ